MDDWHFRRISASSNQWKSFVLHRFPPCEFSVSNEFSKKAVWQRKIYPFDRLAKKKYIYIYPSNKFTLFELFKYLIHLKGPYNTLHKKRSFLLRTFLLNMIRLVVSCGFDHVYWRNPKWKTSFFRQRKVFCSVRRPLNYGKHHML